MLIVFTIAFGVGNGSNKTSTLTAEIWQSIVAAPATDKPELVSSCSSHAI